MCSAFFVPGSSGFGRQASGFARHHATISSCVAAGSSTYRLIGAGRGDAASRVAGDGVKEPRSGSGAVPSQPSDAVASPASFAAFFDFGALVTLGFFAFFGFSSFAGSPLWSSANFLVIWFVCTSFERYQLG